MRKLQGFADREWYAPMVAVFAALDSFIIFVPIEALLVPSILVRPRRWWSSALWVTLGSAVGALALAYVVSLHGEAYVAHLLPKIYHSPSWNRSANFMAEHGVWALAAIAASPIPQQPAVAFSALVHTRCEVIFLAVFVGRAIKYLFVCRLAAFAPRIFRKKQAAIS